MRKRNAIYRLYLQCRKLKDTRGWPIAADQAHKLARSQIALLGTAP